MRRVRDQGIKRTKGLGDQRTKGTEDPKGTRDQGTRGPRNQGTRGPGDHRTRGTRGPGDQRIRETLNYFLVYKIIFFPGSSIFSRKLRFFASIIPQIVRNVANLEIIWNLFGNPFAGFVLRWIWPGEPVYLVINSPNLVQFAMNPP